MLVMPAMLSSLPPLGILVGILALYILAFPANLASLGLHVIIVSRPILVSIIFLGLGLGFGSAWP